MGKMSKKIKRRQAKESMFEQEMRAKEEAILQRVLDLTNASVRDAKKNMGITESSHRSISMPNLYTGRKSTINAFMDCNEDNGTCKACRSRLFAPH